jgi:CheY-like chemotaxis protein
MSAKANEDEVTILVAEDDDGHATLIRIHFEEIGILNEIVRFCDGQEVLDFFYAKNSERKYKPGCPYILLLDIRMPHVDGIEVLKRIKEDPELKHMPVIMLTTTDDPREVEACYKLGCNVYITKPINFSSFSETLRRFGLFLKVIRIAPVE